MTTRQDQRTVFLMYHELELPGRALCDSSAGYVRYIVLASEFEKQMAWLQSQDRQAVSVDQYLSAPRSRATVLTFDDGCETDLIIAAPLLKRLNFNATFYVTVGFLGKYGYLSRAQVRELSDLGFDIGCHSMTHPHLNDVPAENLPSEIVAPKMELEQITGRPVKHFSCPGGRWNAQVLEVAHQAGYISVSTSDARVNTAKTDRFALGRVAVMRDTNFSSFQELCEGRGLWRIQAGFAARALIKRTLGNSTYDRVRATVLRNRDNS
jgi:peptidoglycan/xylan/chitin deacetylase (PgdA/CDA1 family)